MRRVTGDTMPPSRIKLKRVYERPSRTDGRRILVDRLWPRGFSKAEVRISAWLKDVAPSTALRRWFGHDPAKWARFRTRYFRELDSRPQAWRPILTASRHGTVTLVFSSHDALHSNAAVLQSYLRTAGRRATRLPAVAADRSRRSS